MKKTFFAIVALSATLAVSAQTSEVLMADAKGYQHHFGIGVRGGMSSSLQTFMGDSLQWDGKGNMGAVAALDLEYTFLSKLKTNPNVQLGVKTGLSAVYSYNNLTASSIEDRYTNNKMLYTVSAKNLREDQSQVMVELPVLLALKTQSGFVFYTGPKFNFPVYGWYKSSYQNPVVNTKMLTEMPSQVDTKLRVPQFNMLWNMELGYEWQLKNGDGLALTVYADAPLLSLSTIVQPNYCHFLQVGDPLVGGEKMYTNSISNSYGRYISYLDFGLKLTYKFSLPDKK